MGRSSHEDNHDHQDDLDDNVWESRRKELVLASKQLPRVESWNEGGICFHQGFWFSTKFMPNILCFQQHFQAHDQDIILASYPKSGTTWLKSLVFSIVNRKPYVPSQPSDEKRPKLVGHEVDQQNQVEDTPLLKSSPHGLVPFFEFQVYKDCMPHKEYLTGGDPIGSPRPRLFATHVPYVSLAESIKSSTCKIVYIARNPLDVVVSLWHFAQTLPWWSSQWTIEEFAERFCSREFGYGPFLEHLLGFWKESLERPEKVLFLKYEDMKADDVAQVKRLAEFLGFPFSKEEESGGVIEAIVRLCSFGNFKGLEVNQPGKYELLDIENSKFFRKGEVGDWANHLGPSIAEHVRKTIGEKLHDSGLTFEQLKI